MIELTRINKKKFWLNCELIESAEATPDTVLTLTSGKLLIVTEPPELIAERILEFKQAQFGSVLAGVLNGKAPDVSKAVVPPDVDIIDK